MTVSRYDPKPAGRPNYKKLFKELEGDSSAPYSLKEFHKVFMQHMDVSEYSPAVELVGDWEEWKKMKDNCVPLRKEVESWVEEIKVKLYSDSVEQIKLIANSNQSSAFSANKFLIESVAEKKNSNKTRRKGRPSNKIGTTENEAALQSAETKRELERIRKGIELQ